MRRAILLLLSTLFTLGISQSRAKESTLKLSCPAAWPEAPDAKLSRLDFWSDISHLGPLDLRLSYDIYGVDPGDELFCLYANGRRLLITIPGNPDVCTLVKAVDAPNSDHFDIVDGYCTYYKTGDPAKDAVHLREMEPLDRSSSFYGVKLGMTRAQVAAAITPKVAPVQQIYHNQEVYVLPNTRQIVVYYIESPDRVYAMEIKPALGHAGGLADEMRERFGFPEWTNNLNQDTWRGKDGVRLVVQENRVFGNQPFPDENVYLLDGRFIQGLDEQLGLNDR